MANPHFEIKITKRSKRQSAVAGAAYQSGENLFSEYDQKHKNYRKKEGVVYTEIMLPSHAPPEYADREQLWNAVEAVENGFPKPEKFMTLTRMASASGFHPGTGKAIRRTLLTGTSSIMGRSGAPAGKQCRTVIWKW